MDIVPRFWSKVDTSGDCWLWLAGCNPSGYGQIAVSVNGSTKRKIVLAHRVAYELTNGSIPEGLIICHRCNNRRCVNPAHLYAGTVQDNANDRVNSGKPRKEKAVNTTQTINLGKVNSYIVQKTIGGWVVCWLNEDRSIRNVDGGKVHKSRQNAYAKAYRLNHRLELLLKKYDAAYVEYDGYTATVGESVDPTTPGYTLSIQKEALPPHFYATYETLAEVEQEIQATHCPQPIRWQAVKPEDL